MCERPLPTRCGTGWSLFGECCYRLLTALKTYDDHRSDCENLSGQLVSITSLAENNLARQLLFSSCSGSSCTGFIGLRRDSAGQFTSWLDGTPFGGTAYSNWNSNEPNNDGGVEGCAEIIQSTAKWNDVQCGLRRIAVCERSCQTS
ncbi:nattectin [Aphelenchoides avenae]|nr:nattectin [Aphelenchus avenae]